MIFYSLFKNMIPQYIFSVIGGVEFLVMCNYNIEKLKFKQALDHLQTQLSAPHILYLEYGQHGINT